MQGCAPLCIEQQLSPFCTPRWLIQPFPLIYLSVTPQRHYFPPGSITYAWDTTHKADGNFRPSPPSRCLTCTATSKKKKLFDTRFSIASTTPSIPLLLWLSVRKKPRGKVRYGREFRFFFDPSIIIQSLEHNGLGVVEIEAPPVLKVKGAQCTFIIVLPKLLSNVT